MRLFLACAAVLASSLLFMPAMAGACALDGKPSAYADNVPAVIARQPPTAATWSWWAHFAFPGRYRHGQQVVFRENDAQVRKLLSYAQLSRGWRWRFGEGSAAFADRPSHTYRRPGHYRVYVDAYIPGAGWNTFDTISIWVT